MKQAPEHPSNRVIIWRAFVLGFASSTTFAVVAYSVLELWTR